MLIHVKLQNAVDSERQFIFSGRPKRVARDRADERAARKRARDVRESRFLRRVVRRFGSLVGLVKIAQRGYLVASGLEKAASRRASGVAFFPWFN